MSDVIGEAFVDVRARFDKFDKDLDRSRKSVDNRTRQMSKSFGTVENSVTNLRAKIIALATVGGLVALGRKLNSVITSLDDIGKTADKLGLTTDALQELRAAAESAGVSQNTLDMAMQRFGRRLAEARQGTGEAVKALAEMGIALTNSDGSARSMEAVLGDVSDAMAGMAEQTDKNRIAMKLFDSEGVALVNMIGDGKEAMDEMRRAARDMGIVIDESLIRKAEEAKTQIDLLARVTDAQLSSALVNLAPVITAVASAFAFLATQINRAVEGYNLFFGGQATDKNLALSKNLDAQAAAVQEILKLEKQLEGETGTYERSYLTQSIADARGELKQLKTEYEGVAARFNTGPSAGAGKLPPPPALGGGPTPKEDPRKTFFSDLVASTEQQIIAIERQISTFGESDQAILENMTALELLDEVYREFGIGAAELNQAIADGFLPADFRERITDYAARLAEGTTALSEMEDQAEKTARAQADLNRELTDISRNLTDAILRGDSFNEILLMIGQSILDMQSTEDFLTGFFEGLFKSGPSQGGQGGQGGGGIGGLLNTGFNFLLNALPFAEGGNPPIGKWSLVGEKGPELVKFGSPARVYSNSESADMLSGAAGGSSGAVVNMTIVTNDADSFRRNRRQVMAEMSAGADRARVRDR